MTNRWPLQTLSALLLLASLAGAGCAPTATGASAEVAFDGQITCLEPRPEICTRDYRPVCASRDTGVRCVTTPCESSEWQTYGNACSACAEPKVYGYVPGACPVAGQEQAQ